MATAASKALAEANPKKKERRFLEGKLMVAGYFFTYELPKIQSLAATLEKSTQMTFTISENCFTD